MLKYYLPHLTFFIVFLVAAVPVLYYIQRKNPHPRFRPHIGEMSLITLFAVFICGGMAFGLGSLFKPENDGKGMSKKPSVDIPSQGSGESSEGGKKSKAKSGNSDGDEPPRRTLNDRL